MEINFGELSLGDSISSKPTPKTKGIKPDLDFKKDILGIPLKKSKEELRAIEPGHKIGTGQFHIICQVCDVCSVVTPHAHKPEKRKLICLICKTIKLY